MTALLSRICAAGLIVLGLASLGLAAEVPAPLPPSTPWDLKALEKAPAVEWLDRTAKVHTLLYEGEPYKGRKTHVYARYASPRTLGVDTTDGKKYPAVVLVHGGGGHAFPQWAELYAKRGYAAIAMDLAGNKEGEGGKKTEPLPDGGPPQDDLTKFRLPDLPDKDQWTYHAVADVLLAHSLLRSLPEVDADRTGVVGISWGGYLTCIVAAVDPRFKAAVPMYGCGFLNENSAWKDSNFKSMSPEWTKKWLSLWDPSSYVAGTRVPVFFVNGSNDPFYPLDSYAKTFALVRSQKNIRIQLKMAHVRSERDADVHRPVPEGRRAAAGGLGTGDPRWPRDRRSDGPYQTRRGEAILHDGSAQGEQVATVGRVRDGDRGQPP
jgi:cephalosporin-C deacetylase-like acetyl esterase